MCGKLIRLKLDTTATVRKDEKGIVVIIGGNDKNESPNNYHLFRAREALLEQLLNPDPEISNNIALRFGRMKES